MKEMFCKWCGSPINVNNKTCSRCGRAIPALSNCGGFYDLVPNALPKEAQTVVKNTEESPRREPAEKKTRNKARTSGVYVIAALLLILVFLQSVLLIQVSKLSASTQTILQTIEQMQENINTEIKETPEPSEDAEATDPTEDNEETDTAEDNEETDTAEDNEETDTAEDNEETDTAEDNEEADTTEDTKATDPTFRDQSNNEEMQGNKE